MSSIILAVEAETSFETKVLVDSPLLVMRVLMSSMRSFWLLTSSLVTFFCDSNRVSKNLDCVCAAVSCSCSLSAMILSVMLVMRWFWSVKLVMVRSKMGQGGRAFQQVG